MPTENRSSNNEQMVSVPRELLERCDFGKNTAVAMAALPELRALLAQPAAQHRICIEARECEGCNHIGIDDAHNSLAACHECDWNGPEPVEDKCPGCERENVMAAACPDCGSRYVLAALKEIKVPAAQHQGEPFPITNDMHRLMEACRIGEFKDEGGSETVEAFAVASLDAKSSMGHDADSYMAGYSAALYEQAEPFIWISLNSQRQGEPVALPGQHDLPHREEFESADQYAAALGEAKSWNACLDEIAKLGPLYLHPPTSDGFSAGDMADQGAKAFRDGVKASADLIQKRMDDYLNEFGALDPETGSVELPHGGDEYVGELSEIIEAVRSLPLP